MTGAAAGSAHAVRRARPALGTLVELGAVASAGGGERLAEAFAAGWRVLGEVEGALSAFLPGSDVARFNAAPAGAVLSVGPHAAAVLAAAAQLAHESGGLFDVTLGTGPGDWALAGSGGAPVLVKRSAAVRLDLGGIGKGYAVDRAFCVLARALGGRGACWVNAGGDVRVRGVELPVKLRDEERGGARPFLTLSRGAVATSQFGTGARAQLAGPAGRARHVTVLAPRCLWSDALTKVVALAGRGDHPLLAGHGAVAWIHA